jgi:hypothetical protein
MMPVLFLTLGTALAAVACTTTASDTATAVLAPVNAEAARTPVAAVPPAYRYVTMAAGTTLPLALTNSVASDSSAVGDVITAELTRAIRIDGREVLPAGTLLSGMVTDVDGPGRVTGRAMIELRFTSVHTGNSQYHIESTSLWRLAPVIKGEDVTTIDAGTDVVLATKGQDVRLGPGTDVTTRLTVPVAVRVSRN